MLHSFLIFVSKNHDLGAGNLSIQLVHVYFCVFVVGGDLYVNSFKDHLVGKTIFLITRGWSLLKGFTVILKYLQDWHITPTSSL